jgi:hypothetical protein
VTAVAEIQRAAAMFIEQRFDERSYGDAFVAHTRKNLEASGRQWSKPIEDAVRRFVPGRRRDIQQVLGEAGLRPMP